MRPLNPVAEGYAALMARYALPWFLTQTFEDRSHPEAVVKAHRYTCNLINRELHGNNWRRRGIVGVQSILGIERHQNGYPHSHAVMGHPDIDLGSSEFAPLRRQIANTCYAEWGIAKLEVAKSLEHCNAYVAKYICKDGEIVISDHLEALNTGQLSMLGAQHRQPGANSHGSLGIASQRTVAGASAAGSEGTERSAARAA